jgi:SagB-type dehydrogenase family enzyme
LTNADIRAAREFHDRTAHSYQSVRSSGHELDWETKPLLYKLYPDLPEVELPRDFDRLSVDTLAVDPARRDPLTLETLACLLFFSAGVTRTKRYAHAEVHFRAAASTGALYQTEVYVVAGGVDGLAPGVYHFCPGDFRFRRLRDGDFRGALAAAAADEGVARRPATLVLTAIYWRNTWKYQARGFRHLFWDSGTMLANVLAAGDALGLAPRILAGFVDDEVNALLGLDADREAALELVPLGEVGTSIAPVLPVPPIQHATVPLSSQEVDYPLLRRMRAASALASADDVRRWREAVAPALPAARGTPVALPPPRAQSTRALGETILRRASTRQFSSEPITAEELSTTLHHATRAFDADFPSGLVDLHLTVHAAEGIEPGAYVYRPLANELVLLRAGPFRRESAYLSLEQSLGGDAAVTIFFLAPLDAALARFGNRGYRLVNLEAGLAGGRAYLAAYGQGFGASGLTFYDRDVVRFFGREGEEDAIFVTALGRSVRRSPVMRAPLRPGKPAV